MRTHIHWLRISGAAPDWDEAKQYREIQSYLERYPESKVTIHRYESHLFDRVVRLECHQDWNSLDLSANTMSHSLRRLSRKPDNLLNPQPFKVPERLLAPPDKQTHRDREAR